MHFFSKTTKFIHYANTVSAVVLIQLCAISLGVISNYLQILPTGTC